MVVFSTYPGVVSKKYGSPDVGLEYLLLWGTDDKQELEPAQQKDSNSALRKRMKKRMKTEKKREREKSKKEKWGEIDMK